MSRPLSQFEREIVKNHNLAPMYRTARGARVFDGDQIKAAIAVQAQNEIKADGEYFTSQEFRDDVMMELMEEGATLEQATNRTRDQVRLFNEAQRLGLM